MEFKVIRLNSVDWLFIIVGDDVDFESILRVKKNFNESGLDNVIIISDPYKGES
jgi:hypothetical protein